jgi:hypothetical protein
MDPNNAQCYALMEYLMANETLNNTVHQIIQNMTAIQIVKKFPTCYDTWGCTAEFTTARHWTLS